MIKGALYIAAMLVLCAGSAVARNQKTPPDDKAPAVAEQIGAGKIADAVKAAKKHPGAAPDAIMILLGRVDEMITRRQITEARGTLEAARKFATAYGRAEGKDNLPEEALRGRELRVAGIEQSDNGQYAESEVTLNEALSMSQKARDPVLEAGIHNNLGYSLRYQGKWEEAAREFDTARKMAEEQKDDLRAGSYNFNLGLALLNLRRHGPAFDAFKRSAEQNRAADRSSLEARATLYQGISLSNLNSVSAEPIKHFREAFSLFEKLGDDLNCGWSLFFMGDHTAYSFKFAEAADFGEQAIPYFKKAQDDEGLQRCYMLLNDMYTRLEEKEKAAQYQKLAQEIAAQKRPDPPIH